MPLPNVAVNENIFRAIQKRSHGTLHSLAIGVLAVLIVRFEVFRITRTLKKKKKKKKKKKGS